MLLCRDNRRRNDHIREETHARYTRKRGTGDKRMVQIFGVIELVEDEGAVSMMVVWLKLEEVLLHWWW